MKQNKKFIVGVTGGIGSGKSSAAKMIADLTGGRILDADKVSREMTAQGGSALPAIKQAFGPEFIAPDGSLHRARMAELVFRNENARNTLESLIHCKVSEYLRQEAERFLKTPDDPVLVMDVPLPVNNGFIDTCHEVWVIESTERNRIARVSVRSGLSEEQIRARIAAQPSAEMYRKLADVLILNEGSEDDLKAQLIRLLEERQISCKTE